MYTKSEIYEEVKKSLIETNLLLMYIKLLPESSFYGDLGMDSLDTTELLVAIEKKFNITIQNEVARNVQTISDLCNCVQQELEKQKSNQSMATKNLFQKIGKTR